MASSLEQVEENRELWFDGRPVPLENKDIWSFVFNSNIHTFVVTLEQRLNGQFPLKSLLVTEVQESNDLAKLEGTEIVLSSNEQLLMDAKQKGFTTCFALFIQGSQDDLEVFSATALNFDYAIVDFDLPTNIPLELIIARLQDSSTRLLKKESTFDQLEVAFGVLEHGSDGVLLETTDIQVLHQASQYLDQQKKWQIQLQPFVVDEIRHIGMGMRVCVDTTGIMTADEGMLVGSTSFGGILVCSETHYLPYMNLRPFRVNAGALHSYVWMPGDKAEYLSDLTAGSKVLCVNKNGSARELTVGRIKMEMRPLLLIQGYIEGEKINVIVQDDWHIRLMNIKGEAQNSITIKRGDELLGYRCEPGRHVGLKVNEQILEK
ncbi:3-dehydroquinate synthase [Heliorestis acidaminivorans]|uniref:3-dehydroquinate synthase n=2 Tax=Heliorestis acidaminivorans TaxID=553427 RepID=A0A6I0F035_9FIRM|nr:3-dehydroquinate synthase [Heliorestis acidaminivorans]